MEIALLNTCGSQDPVIESPALVPHTSSLRPRTIPDTVQTGMVRTVAITDTRNTERAGFQ